MCIGGSSNPTCANPNETCSISGSGALIPCIPKCDPIAQDCPVSGTACYPVNADFSCHPDVSPDDAGPGSPCEFINVCPAGSGCVNPDLFVECSGGGCCSAFCSTDDPAPVCLTGQQCLPWYADGEAPPGYELVGVCGVPV